MKTCLITGGAGFIGCNLVRFMLKETDYRIINLDALTYAGKEKNIRDIKDDRHIFVLGDICDSLLVSGLFEKYDISLVLALAAESHVDRSITEPLAFVRTNVLGTAALLEAARAWWTAEEGYKPGVKFVQVSTDEVYGSIDDESFTENSPLRPSSPYSASKASGDLLCLAYHTTYKLPVCVSRCSNNYGPYQHGEKLIPKLISQAIKNQPLTLYGDGKNVRDWIYVYDHCRALLAVLDRGEPGEVYNIGAGCERDNVQMARLIIDKTCSDSQIAFIEDRKGHDRRYSIDPSKLENRLKAGALTSFEEGMASTVGWYVKYIDYLLDDA